MISFLQNIAKDLLGKYGEDLRNITVVFPNKRASLFLNQELALQATKPLWSPQYTTISELFQKNSTLVLADRIKLIFELYKSYCKVTGSKETLEQFYGWGEIMLSDFDDVDKHLADAKQVFSLIGDLHEMDSVDYLTEMQRKALQQFFRNFDKVNETELKRRFREFWNKFYDIYADFKERLFAKRIGYEGAIYRVCFEGLTNGEQMLKELATDTPYIFIGFNHLTTVEERMIDFFVSKTGGMVYLDNEKCMSEDLSIISSPTDDLQARYVTRWLTPERIAAGRKTAIVLADESLLETILHCLPEDVTLNITVGYPLSQSPITSLIKLSANLLVNFQKDYKLHDVNAILRHPLAKYLSPEIQELHDKLNKELIYYLNPNELSIDENLKQFFAPLKDKASVVELIDRLCWIVKTIATCEEHDALMTEALYRMYTLLNRLKGLVLDEGVTLDISLFNKLLQQIIQSTTIPFHGEPIEGIQVMGVLETRNLDFDHVLLLSCNEGKIPARINDSSFIPHSVRVGYDLTTIENKVSIYEYYFDRLLQRTKDVTLVYNSATTDGKTGEMSRFMLQLMTEQNVKMFSLEADQYTSSHVCEPIQKTQNMIDAILSKEFISPSALGKYLRCPLLFYYLYVLGISVNDNSDEEEMDSASFGTIFHTAAEMFYRNFEGRIVPQDYLRKISEEKGHPTLREIVTKAFREELFNIQDDPSTNSGIVNRPTPKLSGLQTINFEMVVKFLVNLLRYDASLTRLEINGLEQKVKDEICVDIHGTKRLIKIGGKIDRLDMVTDSDGIRRIRVIDYKTGHLSKKLSAPDVASVFMRDMDSEGDTPLDHADYFLQALLYSYIIERHQQTKSEISAGLLYVQQATAENYDPLLNIGGGRLTDATLYLADFQRELSALISEILDIDKPFCPTSDEKRCDKCPFFNFCH